MGKALRLALLVGAVAVLFMPLSDLWSNVGPGAAQVGSSEPSSSEEQPSRSGSGEQSAGLDSEGDERQADAAAADLLKLMRQQQTAKARVS